MVERGSINKPQKKNGLTDSNWLKIEAWYSPKPSHIISQNKSDGYWKFEKMSLTNRLLFQHVKWRKVIDIRRECRCFFVPSYFNQWIPVLRLICRINSSEPFPAHIFSSSSSNWSITLPPNLRRLFITCTSILHISSMMKRPLISRIWCGEKRTPGLGWRAHTASNSWGRVSKSLWKHMVTSVHSELSSVLISRGSNVCTVSCVIVSSDMCLKWSN